MDTIDRLIISIVDWNDASWLIQLISWQLFFRFFVHKFALIQVASVVVALADNHTIGKHSYYTITFCNRPRTVWHCLQWTWTLRLAPPTRASDSLATYGAIYIWFDWLITRSTSDLSSSWIRRKQAPKGQDCINKCAAYSVNTGVVPIR